MIGVYQHCGEKHLHRYLAEFDFRYFEPQGAWPKGVYVTAYRRFRFGKWEHVCSHCRSYPS